MSVKIDGMRELLNNLSKKAEEIDKATKRANTAVGKIVAEELKRNVPKSGYVGSNVQAKLSDNIVVSITGLTNRHLRVMLLLVLIKKLTSDLTFKNLEQ